MDDRPPASSFADDQPIPLPVDGTLDLHTFRPADIKPLLDDYLGECRRRGILLVRIIHGKGIGTLRQTVQTHLSRSPLVQSFHVAADGGGWGATVVRLKPLRPQDGS